MRGGTAPTRNQWISEGFGSLRLRDRELKRRLKTVRTQLQYGRGDLAVEIPSSNVTVLRTKHERGLPDEVAAFRGRGDRDGRGGDG